LVVSEMCAVRMEVAEEFLPLVSELPLFCAARSSVPVQERKAKFFGSRGTECCQLADSAEDNRILGRSAILSIAIRQRGYA